MSYKFIFNRGGRPHTMVNCIVLWRAMHPTVNALINSNLRIHCERERRRVQNSKLGFAALETALSYCNLPVHCRCLCQIARECVSSVFYSVVAIGLNAYFFFAFAIFSCNRFLQKYDSLFTTHTTALRPQHQKFK